MKQRKVLFLCTGNSCRSQMAEALVNDRLGASWSACSAGTRPAGSVHPLALAALAEIGIRHSGVPKSVEVFRGTGFDLVVTVCDAAASDCPAWTGQGRRVHHALPDPAVSCAVEDFRAVRDRIVREILPLLQAA